MGLRILITNNTLSARAGSELYVRDVATALLKRGHTPIAFSTVLGDVARELRSLTIPVIDNLHSVTAAPDIIHGQHHVETMTALLHFPDTPAVSFCHGWLPWEETPPHFPRILRYVAVDHTCRDRLVFENGIPEDRVRVLFNFVDLERFRPRGPLPVRPQRALVFNSESNKETHVPKVREACGRAGVALDVISLSAGTACAEPEKVLGDYDIVFAKARSAIEAMAVGTAVVLYGGAAMGSMVTTRDLDRLRPLNFGIRALQEPISVDALEREIARYDANDSAQVSRHIRAVAGRDGIIDEILSIYEEVIEEHKDAKLDPVAEERAAADYLRWLSPRLKESDLLHGQKARLAQELTDCRQKGIERERLNSSFAEGEHASLTRKIREYESKAIELEHQARKNEQKAAALTEELADREARLARITNSLGWRLLSRYGPIKYRFVLPAYRQLKKLFSDKTT